ncbi:unnamed protein product [Parnassius apollo]|uniref:(apollo) hypothetical protein n=1 Tax=Parnassius apollo TaxID=110799 RepID=A0A8S3WYQ2_PARAO|nr:unnamed protein product [Parnassius apollo]
MELTREHFRAIIYHNFRRGFIISIIIIITSLHKSTAEHRPPSRYATKHGPDLPASIDFLHVLPGVTPSSGGSPYTSPTGTRLPLENLFSPTVVGSSSYMAGPLPLQLINPLGCVGSLGHSGSTAVILISRFNTQRNPEHSPLNNSLSDFERPHTTSSEGPRLGSVGHQWQHALVVQLIIVSKF